MQQKRKKQKKRIDDDLFYKALNEYLDGEPILSIAKKYNLPYSTIRRHILEYLEQNEIEDPNDYEIFPYEGFECLEVGDTFSWFPGGTIFKVKALEKAPYGEFVWKMYRVKERSDNHYYPEDLDKCKK